MNSATNTLSIDAASGTASAPPFAANTRAWFAKAGWNVWYGLQSYGARRALREMRIMGLGVDYNPAPPADGKDAAKQRASQN